MFELVTAYTETYKVDDETMKGFKEAEEYMNTIHNSVSPAIRSAVRSSVDDSSAYSPIPELEIGEYISPLSVATQSETTD